MMKTKTDATENKFAGNARKRLMAVLIGATLALGATQLIAQSLQGGGYGPGMMGGYGGYGMGPGMMSGYGSPYGGGPVLNLSAEQRGKIAKIQDDLRRKQWELMGKVHDEYASRSNTADDAAASKSEDRIDELQRQMFNNGVAVRKQTDAVLTKEQRQQLRGYDQ